MLQLKLHMQLGADSFLFQKTGQLVSAWFHLITADDEHSTDGQQVETKKAFGTQWKLKMARKLESTNEISNKR